MNYDTYVSSVTNINMSTTSTSTLSDISKSININTHDTILISGCGGGYDIFTGLPLYFELLSKHTTNHFVIANLSFTHIDLLKKFSVSNRHYYKVKFDDSLSDDKLTFFPEYELSRQLNKEVYCFVDDGLVALQAAYTELVKDLNINIIFLCDGGCDSIMSGIEYDLGTPVEDMMSIYIVDTLLKNKLINNAYLTLLGTTVDTFIEIHHDDYIANVNQLKNKGGLLYTAQLSISDSYVNQYINIFSKCHPKNSIINCCIVASLEGNYGDYQHKYLEGRCELYKFNITSDTSTYYILSLEKVAEHVKYLGGLSKFDNSDDIDTYIMEYNTQHKK